MAFLAMHICTHTQALSPTRGRENEPRNKAMKKQTAQVMNDIVSTTRVSVFIEAMNMPLNPLVFHTGAEYKRRVFAQY